MWSDNKLLHRIHCFAYQVNSMALYVIEFKSHESNVKGRVIYFLGMGANSEWNVKHDYD